MRRLGMNSSTALSVGVAMLLTGCATAKPPLPTAQYDGFANGFAAVQLCGQSGKLSPDAALWAKRRLSYNLSTWDYDPNLINANFQRALALNSTVSIQDCNKLAMDSAEYRHIVEENNAQVDSNERAWQNQIQTNRPINTYCNTIGTQTFCNSY